MFQKKCECYWPQDVGASHTYDLVTVTMVAEQEYADYAYRMLKVTKGVRGSAYYTNITTLIITVSSANRRNPLSSKSV